MATSKVRLAEQALYRISGGMVSVTSPVQLEDVIAAAGQIINTLFKTQHYTATLPSGDTMPNGLMLATYTGIVPTAYGEKSKAALPIMPIALPRDMGVYEIFVSKTRDNNQSISDVSFIPLQPGHSNLLRSQTLISSLLGQIGFTRYGKDVVFEKNLLLYDVTELTMRLAIMDIDSYSDTDSLPIPPDFENDVVDELVKRFAPVTGRAHVSDIIAPAPQNSK